MRIFSVEMLASPPLARDRSEQSGPLCYPLCFVIRTA